MCKQNYKAWRMVGVDLAVINAGVGDSPTNITPNANDGDIAGFSVAENYSRTILAKTLLTIETDQKEKPLINVPLTQLLPDGERQMWPLMEVITRGTKIKAILTCRDNTMASANPVVLVLHHNPIENCK
jgi:hypothetical protein